MSNRMSLTNAGLSLMTRALKGETINFIGIATGDGKPGNTDINKLTKLKSEKLRLAIQSLTLSQELGTAELVCSMSNLNLHQGFYAREWGIIAQDPQDKSEILYAYCNKNDEAMYLEGYDGFNPITLTFSFTVIIGRAKKVTANVILQERYATVNNVRAMIDSIFWDNVELKTPSGIFCYTDYDKKHLVMMKLDDLVKVVTGTDNPNRLSSRMTYLEGIYTSIKNDIDTLKAQIAEIKERGE